MLRWIRSLSMPLAIVLGLLFPFGAKLASWIHWGLGILLFFGFLRVDFQEFKSVLNPNMPESRRFFGVLGLAWMGLSVLGAVAIVGMPELSPVIWPIFMVVMAPMATASPATASLLGLRISWILVGILVSHLVAILWIPLMLGLLGSGFDLDLATSVFSKVILGVAPLVLVPLFLAWAFRRAGGKIPHLQFWSQLIWFVVLYLVVSKASLKIQSMHELSQSMVLIGIGVLLLCLLQYGLGNRLGGPALRGEGALVLGQRNTVFVIWVAQNYASEYAALAVFGPLFYVLWQNALLSGWIAWSGVRRGTNIKVNQL